MGKKLVPDYEVKLLVDPEKVLDKDGNLIKQLKDDFGIGPDSKKMAIQFIDTQDQKITKSDWCLRIRRTEGEDDFETTWKKRYTINVAGGDHAANIDEKVQKAFDEGFDKKSGWNAQVEVGFQKQTLSISLGRPGEDKNYDGMSLPNAEHSQKMLTKKPPQQYEDLGPRLSTGAYDRKTSLDGTHVFGPVNAKRYQGKWGDENTKLYIEVWPIQISKTDPTLKPTVEVSFKTKKLEDAMEGIRELGEFLKARGWLLEVDSLKTGTIMTQYRP